MSHTPTPQARPAALAGLRVLVTSSSRAMGTGICCAMAAAGARVAVCLGDDRQSSLDLAQRILAGGGEAIDCPCDVGDEAQVGDLFQRVADRFGGVDVLVSESGRRATQGLADCTLADWESAVRTNLTGTFLCVREAVRAFQGQRAGSAGIRDGGRIVCVTPGRARAGWAGQAGAAAARAGVAGLVQALAQELAPYRIRVNGIAPGAIRGPEMGADRACPTAEAALLEQIPAGRMGTAEDVGRAAVWLASDDSEYVTGVTLRVDGGLYLGHFEREDG